MIDWRCDQCTHWGKEGDNEWDFENAGLKRCAAIRQAWDVVDDPFEQEGSKPRWDYDDWAEVERLENAALRRAKAVAQDGSSYHASIRTTADFGCVLFEASMDDRNRPEIPA